MNFQLEDSLGDQEVNGPARASAGSLAVGIGSARG